MADDYRQASAWQGAAWCVGYLALLCLVGCGQPAPGGAADTPEPAPSAEPAEPAPTAEGLAPASPTATPAATPPEATSAPSPTGRPAIPRPPTTTRLPRPTAPATPAPPTGQVPSEILDRLVANLTARAGVKRAAIALVQAQAVTWNDGSLGCPQPGVSYSQAQVAGFRVILRANNRDYDYHVGARGSFVLCDQPRVRVTPPANDRSPSQ
jgi:hypothetical protein